MKTIPVILFSLFSLHLAAQEITGTVLHEKMQPMIGALVQAYNGGILDGSCLTDIDGRYDIKTHDAGKFDVMFSHAGYDTVLVINLIVHPGERTTQNFRFSESEGLSKKIVVRYRSPLCDNCPGRYKNAKASAIDAINIRDFNLVDPSYLYKIFNSFPKPDFDNPCSYIYTREQILNTP